MSGSVWMGFPVVSRLLVGFLFGGEVSLADGVCKSCVWVWVFVCVCMRACVFYVAFIHGVLAPSKTYTFVYEFCLA